MAKKKYQAAMKIDMGGGVEVEAGEEVEMEADEAQPLLENGSLIDPSAKAAETKPAAKKDEGKA